MDSERSFHPGATLLGFAAGAVVGAGLGYLLAQDEEKRRHLKVWLRREAQELGHKRDQILAAYRSGRRAYTRADGERAPA